MNSAVFHVQAGGRTVIFVPNRERARRRAPWSCVSSLPIVTATSGTGSRRRER
ncbi:hypothetical protein ACIRPK_31635 [Kitasatospora sp. NPDC101801]|uniref:hypothetical protein n=1 Tax=Kitasatospora sp. NPDC101801 TaxID=3364103 RepID=UPI0038283B3E